MLAGIQEATLKAYLPTDRYQSYVIGQELPELSTGALLFADIVGFTPLTERLVTQLGDRAGAEELTRLLNIIYKALISVVQAYRGSVIYFSGDAITCWFDADADFPLAVHRATTAGFVLQEVIGQLEKSEAASINIKISLACGVVRRFVVGAPTIQLFDIIAGKPLEQLAQTEQLARSGEILATSDVVKLLGNLVTVSEWRTAPSKNFQAALLDTLTQPALPQPWEQLPLPAALESKLQNWLLPAIVRAVEQGLSVFFTELRPVAALFMQFSGLDFVDDPEVGPKLNNFIRTVQTILQEFGGNLIQLTVGEKGSYLYAAFGAPVSYQNDAERAVWAAQRLLDSCPSYLSMKVGLSYGTMRTGAYGCAERATFGVLGDEVNLAARLMTAAPVGGALISSRLYKRLRGRLTCRSLPPLKVKGKAVPIGVYELTKTAEQPLNQNLPQLPFVGRDSQLTTLLAKLAPVLAGCGQLITLIGEAGLGKSRLVSEFEKKLPPIPVYKSEAQAYTSGSSYISWRPIFQEILGINPNESNLIQIRQLKTRIAELGANLNARLPLLNPLLGLGLPENEFTGTLELDLRKNLLEALAIELLEAYLAKHGPIVVILENCHWLDALSQSLLMTLSQRLPDLAVMLLLTYRVEPDNDETKILSALPAGITNLRLQGLGDSQMRELLKHRVNELTRQELDFEYTDSLVKRVEGNPFYLEELLNLLFSEPAANSSPNSTSQLDITELPDTLHGLILSHLDKLGETEKAILKVASVIGRNFEVEWLAEIPLLPHDPLQIQAALDRLVASNLILPQAGSYIFRHGLTQEITYQSLLGEHKRILHEAVGQLVEQKFANSILPVDLLAYHFGLSSNTAKQRLYWGLAGRQAQASYANPIAVQYYSRLIALLGNSAEGELEQEWFEVNYQLSRVLYAVGRWEDAEKICRKALAALTVPCGTVITADWFSEKQTQYQLVLISNLIATDQLAEARQLAEVICQTEKQPVYLADALTRLGWLNILQDNYEAAIDYLEQSLKLFRELNDYPKQASTLKNLGVAGRKLQRWEWARQCMEESLQLYRQVGDQPGLAATLDALAMVLIDHLGELDTAQQYLEESLSLNRKMGSRRAMAYNLNNLGVIADRRGDYKQAHKYYEAQLLLRRDLKDTNGLVLALYNTGAIAINYLKDLALAKNYYQEALQVSSQHNYKFGRAISQAGLGCIQYLQKEPKLAFDLLSQTLILTLELKTYSYTLPTLALLASVLTDWANISGKLETAKLQHATLLCGCIEANAPTGGILDTLLDTPACNIYAQTLQTLRAQVDSPTFESCLTAGQQTSLAECLKLLPDKDLL